MSQSLVRVKEEIAPNGFREFAALCAHTTSVCLRLLRWRHPAWTTFSYRVAKFRSRALHQPRWDRALLRCIAVATSMMLKQLRIAGVRVQTSVRCAAVAEAELHLL